MSMALKVVDETGIVSSETGLDEIVFRRREATHEPGSEVAIRAGHAPLLALSEACVLRLKKGCDVKLIPIRQAVVEVAEGSVTFLID